MATYKWLFSRFSKIKLEAHNNKYEYLPIKHFNNATNVSTMKEMSKCHLKLKNIEFFGAVQDLLV